MDTKPTRYVVEYEDNELFAKEVARHDGYADCVDPSFTFVMAGGTDDIEQARETARGLRQAGQTGTIIVLERVGIAEWVEEDAGRTYWDFEYYETVEDEF